MNQFFVGNTLINDAYLGSIRIEDLLMGSSSLNIDYLVIGGGGGGGDNGMTTALKGGGGGAGGLVTGSATILKQNTNYQVIVGFYGDKVSGSNGLNGTPSSLIGGAISAIGIGGGGGGKYAQNGLSGGSGGGGGGATPGSTTGGTGTAGQGNNGAPDYDIVANTGGGGGGAAAAATTNIGASGSIWLDGVEYGRGGDSGAGQQAIGYGGGGPWTKNANYGNVIIRYPGTGSKATGGNITYSNGYTYHQFITFGTGSYIPTSSFTY